MATTFQTTPFEPVGVYDSPRLAMSMLLDDDATWSGIHKAFFSPERLSLDERNGFAERLKQATGNHAVSNALIGVATNPFVWLMFVTSPSAASSLNRMGASGFFSVGKAYHKFIDKNEGILQSMGVLTPLQVFEKTAVGPAAIRIGQGIKRVDDVVSARLQPALEKFFEQYPQLRDKGLNPERYAKSTPERKLVEDINDTMFASLDGWGEKSVQHKPVFADDSFKSLQVVKEERGPLVTADIEGEVSRLGLQELRNAHKDARKDAYAMLIGDWDNYVATGQIKADPTKVLNLARGSKRTVQGMRPSYDRDRGAEVIARIVGPEAAERLAKEGLSLADFHKVVSQVAEVPLQSTHYVPRNLTDIAGHEVSEAIRARIRDARSFVSTGSIIPRTEGELSYYWKDLARMKDKFGATPELDGMLANAYNKQEVAATEKGVQTRYYRMNIDQQMKRYYEDSARSYSLYVQDMGDEVRVAHGSAMKSAAEWNPDIYKAVVAAEDYHGSYPSVADVLFETHAMMEDKHSKALLSDLVVPQATGTLRPEEGVSYAAALRGKKMLSQFTESPMGQLVKKVGKHGEDLHAKMVQMADPEVPLSVRAPINASRGVASYLYLSHLGFNMGSAVVNLLQPTLMVAPYLGTKSTLVGYAKAMKEMMGYVADRVKMPKLLTETQKLDLVRKNFQHERNGNLLGIASEAISEIDNLHFRQFGYEKPGRTEGIADMMMSVFQKSEWFNRLVTAHAAEDALRSRGLWSSEGPAAAEGTGFVRRMVQETQFGGNPVNVPTIMQKGWLSNPLLRQFGQFPLRSLTGVLRTGFLGEGQRTWGLTGIETTGWGLATAHDITRMLGMAAFTYEVGKGMLGWDLSRGLAVDAATGLLGGDRLLEQKGELPVPLPPLLGIPLAATIAFATEDTQLWRRTLPRVIPGGVALSRAMTALPNLETAMPGGWLLAQGQRQYADYQNLAPDGGVPIYDIEGNLIRYERPSSLYAKAAGFNLAHFKTEGQQDQMLLANREEVVKYRHGYMSALLASQPEKAATIKAEFEKRFKFPMTISRAQMKALLFNRAVTRPERILDRIPPGLRQRYAEQLAQGDLGQFGGVTAQQLTEIETSRRRLAARGLTPQVPALPPDAVQSMKQSVAEVQAENEARAGRMYPFSGYQGQGYGR